MLKCHSLTQIAHFIANRVAAAGFAPVICMLDELPADFQMEAYSRVIIASSVRGFKFPDSIVEFVRSNADVLNVRVRM